MDRRRFLGTATAAAIATGLHPISSIAEPEQQKLRPMALGLLVSPYGAPEATIKRVHDMGFSNCFLSLDGYIGKFTSDAAKQMGSLLNQYDVVATTVEVVGPAPLVWDFLQGPATIGLVPPKTRAARIDALRQASDFAKLLGIGQVQTHCGFIPEDPADPLYRPAVDAIRAVAQHCHGNGQAFLMETGQETPTAMSRALRDANMPNLGVGLDTANLILYGKANPVDAVDILGPHVRSIHAKDGKWPTDPSKLGEEVMIGQGLVDFKTVFTKLHAIGYTGAVTIERETSGPQQVADVKNEKDYLQRILDQVLV
ncbi:MAG TPA: sugar phosphate isomerase/epimerase family protein [Terracidiphilus sp.]|jgi:sugar phosphate isomerase/epimerase